MSAIPNYMEKLNAVLRPASSLLLAPFFTLWASFSRNSKLAGIIGTELNCRNLRDRNNLTMTGGKMLQFPHGPVLLRLFMAARQTSDSRTIIHDALGFEKSYPELLSDVLKTQELFRARLPPSAINCRGLLRRESQYIGILATSGYEFLFAFFSIRAMGGVCVPLGERPCKSRGMTES